MIIKGTKGGGTIKGLGMKVVLLILLILSFTVSSAIMSLFDYDFGGILTRALNMGDITPLIIFIVIMVLVMGALGSGSYFIVKRFKGTSGSNKKMATSKMASYKEIQDLCGTDGVVIGKKVQLTASHSFSHILLTGVTGSGKSASYFIPNLVSLPNASFVVTDPKGELARKTAATNLKQGKRVLVFSPFKKNSLKYNPLTLCDTETEVRELAMSLLVNGNASVEAATGSKSGGGEWLNMAAPLLTAFMIHVRMLPEPKNTVSNALSIIVENDLDTLKFIMQKTHPMAKKQFNIFLQSAGSEATASSIKTVLATNLQLFLDPMIENLTSVNEINPKMLRERPTVLYIVVPEHKSDMMAPLMAPFYSQIIAKLIETEGTPIFFFMDEFANIGVINGIDKYLATIRSRKMSITLGIQSINQLKQKYGTETAGTILDNLKSKIILPGSSFETADYYSKLIGNEEISTTSSSSSSDSKGASYSESKTRKELFAADEIRRLPNEKLLIVTDNRNPFMDDQNRYYKNQKYIDLTSQEVDVDEYIEWYRKKMKKS